MARRKDRRRVSKEQLTLAVRKDFNAAAVSEQEVVTSFLYSIHNQSMLSLPVAPLKDDIHSLSCQELIEYVRQEL